MNVIKNDLFDYNNRYIYQPSEGFKFSLDSVLLAEFVSGTKPKDTIVDICSGLAPVSLVLSTKIDNKIFCIEIQKNIADISKKSIELNKLDNQIEIINDDLKNIGLHFKTKSIDIITCNPPYFKIEDSSLVNEIEQEKFSRHEFLIKLEDIFEVSSKVLNDNGVLYMVHRPQRLDEIIILANKYNLKVKEIVNVQTDLKGTVKTILVKCVKNSKYGLKIRNINVFNIKTYKNIFEEGNI